ncbi:hypothetical protein [Herpetosiphon geysericola]|uniref:Uncharacterized protein n=1 Tax=Herpetosiphon geysericola TaxID=70996 RepID=A0A0P6YNW7_9CHLR|nr:hypothetical protein [Herpetosiphon geysericola]KPL91992.1 hypothetical protein SE18_00080 [Herpetosiphon geysericola]
MEKHSQRAKIGRSWRKWSLLIVIAGLGLLITLIVVAQTTAPLVSNPTLTALAGGRWQALDSQAQLTTTPIQPIPLIMATVPNMSEAASVPATILPTLTSVPTLAVATPAAEDMQPDDLDYLQTATALALKPTPLPTSVPATPQFIGLISAVMNGEGDMVQQIDTNRQAYLVAEHVVITVQRYDQPPVLLQQSEPNSMQLTDSLNAQWFQWQFAKPVDVRDFELVLSSNQQQLLIKTQQDLFATDRFIGSIQVATLNIQTGELQVVADSLAWPELKWARLLAWQGDHAYFFNEQRKTRDLWRLQVAPELQAEKMLEIPLAVGFDAATDTHYAGEVLVAPNQRWLLYSLPHPNGMLLRVVDLTTEQFVELEMPLLGLDQISFAPDGESFAVMLPAAQSTQVYPALYHLASQRWFRLAANQEYAMRFEWSANADWLLYRTPANQLNIYNTRQPSLTISGYFVDSGSDSGYPLALLNDGKTILIDHYESDRLEQYRWNDQAWQLEWRIKDAPINQLNLLFVYPR